MDNWEKNFLEIYTIVTQWGTKGYFVSKIFELENLEMDEIFSDGVKLVAKTDFNNQMAISLVDFEFWDKMYN